MHSEAGKEPGNDGDVEMEPSLSMCRQHWCPWFRKCSNESRRS